MRARPARDTSRIEIGVLVKRNREGAVGIAKDISALSAVMPARKVAKVLLACCVITYGGILVGLYGKPC